MKKTITALAAVGLIASLALVGPLGAKPGNKYGDTTREGECELGETGDGLLVEITGPEKLWPPNHKYVPLSVTATSDDPGDEVTLATEGTHDQYLEDGSEMNGSGNTDEDVNPAMDVDTGTGSAETAHDVRAERSGRDQNGRTYTIMYEATTDDGDSCLGEFEILVPHDMRGGADWK